FNILIQLLFSRTIFSYDNWNPKYVEICLR
ncbi:unnamed protein product, partial [Onchocerca ochengi]|uniref:Uncharacterized protein n=1 Tax=Onchocerca ochengi TaxID=42157 RepID=A0A182EVP4_ONCOC